MTGYVIDQCQPRARRDTAHDGFLHLSRGLKRKRQTRHHDFRSRARRDEFKRIAAGVVFVVGHQQFVTWRKSERAQNCVDSTSGVGHENQVFQMRSDELGQRRSRLI